MGDVVVAAASRRIKDADSKNAIELISVLVSVGDKRTVPILRQALDHVDYNVRKACLAALADMGGTEAEQMLVGALDHWDPETRRVAAREIGRAGAVSAMPRMLYILQGYYFFEQNYSLKKDVIGSLEALGSPAAVPTLRRMAGRKFVIGRKNRELRFLARRALEGIERSGIDRGEKAS
jgi:HEAT repeat protein